VSQGERVGRDYSLPEADLAVGQRGQLTPWHDLVNKVACF